MTSASVLGLTLWRAWEFLRVRSRLRALTQGHPSLEPDTIAGHQAYGAWHFIATPSDGDHGTERYERWTYRYTVQGLLPTWLLMNWSAQRSAQDRGTLDYLPVALFGADLTYEVPPAWTLVAESGDLVVQSEERYRLQVPTAAEPQVHAVAKGLTRAFLTRGLHGFERELRQQVEMEGQAEALRLYCRHFQHAAGHDPFVQASLHHEVAAVRVVAAQHTPAAGVHVLRESVLDPHLPTRVRREAARALVQQGRHDILIEVARAAPQDLEDILTEGLVEAPGDVESLVLPFLAHPQESVVQSAVHALARRGTGASVGPMRTRRGLRSSRELRDAIEVAVRLIQDRGRDAQAGLSLLSHRPIPPTVGRVSMAGAASVHDES